MSPRLLSGAARLAGSSLLRLQTDDRLVALARTGQGPAFAAIVERYHDELLRYAERLVGPSRAEDVLQQALLNAHLAMPSTDDTLKLRPWLYRITHNVAVNVLRAARPQTALDDRAAAPGAIDEDVEVRQRLHAALEAIARLPEPQRDALTLRAIEGRSHEEVAAALGVTAGAARQQVHRARTTLRAAVSAVTPYSLLARFAMAGSGSSLPTTELTAGAGVGAAGALTKVAATVLAAGALAGGATQLPTGAHHRSTKAGEAAAATPGPGGSAGAPARAADDSEPGDDRAARGSGRGRNHREDAGRHRRRHGSSQAEDRHHGGEDRRGTDDGASRDLADRHGGSGSGDDALSSGSGSGEDRRGDDGSGPSDTSGSGAPDPSGSGSDGSGSGGGDSLSSGPGSGETTPLAVVDDSLSGTSGSRSSGSGSIDSGSGGYDDSLSSGSGSSGSSG